MAKGIDVVITKGSGGTPVTYALSRQINGGGYSVIDASIAYTASPQTYSDTGPGGTGFSDEDDVDYTCTATNADGTSSASSVATHVISGGGATGDLMHEDNFDDTSENYVSSANTNRVIAGGTCKLTATGTSNTIAIGMNNANMNLISDNFDGATYDYRWEFDIVNNGTNGTYGQRSRTFPVGDSYSGFTGDGTLEHLKTDAVTGAAWTVTFRKVDTSQHVIGEYLEISAMRLYRVAK